MTTVTWQQIGSKIGFQGQSQQALLPGIDRPSHSSGRRGSESRWHLPEPCRFRGSSSLGREQRCCRRCTPRCRDSLRTTPSQQKRWPCAAVKGKSRGTRCTCHIGRGCTGRTPGRWL
eukprot:3184436-Rhodomonas_salina.2